MINYHMKKNNLKPNSIEITTKMKRSCGSAYQRYKSFLKKEKKKKNQEKNNSAKQILN